MMRKLSFSKNTAGRTTCHMSHTRGVNRFLKHEASKKLRSALKQEAADQVADIDEPVAAPPPVEPGDPAVYWGHLDRFLALSPLDDLLLLLKYRGKTTADVQFVSNGGAYCYWDEFVVLMKGVTDERAFHGVAVAGRDWYAEYVESDWGMSWAFRELPSMPQYHLPMAFLPEAVSSAA